MKALKAGDNGRGWGARRLLADFERRLESRAAAAPPDLHQPLRLLETTVPAAWIDYNGHMTEHRYLEVASYGLVLMNVNSYVQQIIIGLILVAVVAFDQFAKSRRLK